MLTHMAQIAVNAFCDKPNHWNCLGSSPTHAPCVFQRRPSRSATIVASVTTIEGIRTYATSQPLRAPHNAPTRQPTNPLTETGRPDVAHTPVMTLQTAKTDP